MRSVWVTVLALGLCGCGSNGTRHEADWPRLAAGVTMRDVRFHSQSLSREIEYRVLLPAAVERGAKLPVIYLLHARGGSFRSWSNYTDAARLAGTRAILVMPEGGDSYFTNSATNAAERWEDYTAHDLIADVEARFPAATDRTHRAIAGVSMGGYGAVKIALRHPDLYAFAGGLSAALDVPSRRFSVRRVGQWRDHRRIFGPWNGPVQQENDPYVLARQADPARAPYLYLICGDREGLLAANRDFAQMLKRRGFRYEFHTPHGDHDWKLWSGNVDELFERMRASGVL